VVVKDHWCPQCCQLVMGLETGCSLTHVSAVEGIHSTPCRSLEMTSFAPQGLLKLHRIAQQRQSPTVWLLVAIEAYRQTSIFPLSEECFRSPYSYVRPG
jgi:hypothetical protein